MPQSKRVFWETTGGEPEVLAPHVESQSSGGWVLQSETVSTKAGLANQVTRRSLGNQDPPSVLLVGASVRWAAQSAVAGGYRVVGMDLFGDLDTRATCARFEQIKPAEQAAPKKLAETVATLAGQERARVVWVGGLRGAVDESNGLSRRTHEELAELARRAGFRFPETFSANDGSVSSNSRWLVKEPDSTGGLGVHFRDRWPHRTIPATAILQRWIPGRSLGLVALAEKRGVSLLGMTRSIYQRCGDLPFVYAGSRTFDHADAVPWSAMQSLCEQVAETRGLRGLFNLDWIRDRRDQWWLLEINERPSASCEVIERAQRHSGHCADGDSLMRWHLAAVLPKLRTSSRRRKMVDGAGDLNISPPPSTHIKRIVYSHRDGRAYLSTLAQAWQTNASNSLNIDESPRRQLADIPADGTPVQRGQPIATLLIDSGVGVALQSKTLRQEIRKIQAGVKSTSEDDNG